MLCEQIKIGEDGVLAEYLNRKRVIPWSKGVIAENQGHVIIYILPFEC